MKTLPEVLLSAAELIEKGWCQRDMAQDSKGVGISSVSPDAARWCLLGAVRRSILGLDANEANPSAWEMLDRASDYLRANLPYGSRITSWNDSSKRTKEDVIQLLRKTAASITQ